MLFWTTTWPPRNAVISRAYSMTFQRALFSSCLRGPVRGIAELREFYKAFLTKPPSGFPKAFELLRRDVDGKVAYIVWKAEPGVQLATDTFFVRDRKIMVRTFAASFAA